MSDVTREELLEQVSRLTKERDEAFGWMEAARFHYVNEDYYRGLVDQIGEMLGPAARTADDGKLGPEVLRAKVPEVVASTLSALSARVQELEGALKGLLAVSPKHPECEPAGPWCAIFRARAALESGTGQKSTNEGLKCPPGESAVGAAHISNHGSQQGHGGGVVGSVQTEAVAQRTTGAGTGEQVGREPSPMPEAPAVTEPCEVCREPATHRCAGPDVPQLSFCVDHITSHTWSGPCKGEIFKIPNKAPAPKTFTVLDVVAAWEAMLRDNPRLFNKPGVAWKMAFIRALGLGEP